MADELQRIIRLDVNATEALAELAKLRKATEGVEKQTTSMADKLGASVASVTKVVGVLGTAFAAFKGVKAITDAGDQIRNLEGSFTSLLGSATRAKDMLQQVYQVAGNTGAGLTDVAGATQKLAIALNDAGASNSLIAQISENFIKLGRIGGSSMAEVTGGLIQFTQALASGRLGGDELKTILEGMPLVAKAIAKELNVSVGALKQLGADGKITADILVNALLNPTKQIGEEFAKLPVTLEQAFNNLQTTTTKVLYNFDQISGISKTIATMLAFISDQMEGVNSDLGQATENTSGWSIAVEAVGNAFRGVVIVVNAVVAGIAATLVSLKGLATAQLQLLNPREWKNLGQTFSDTVKSVKEIRESTLQLNKNLMLGTTPAVKAASKATRDFEENQKKVAAALLAAAAAADKNGKAGKAIKPPDPTEWEKWVTSLEKSVATMELIPQQLAYLNTELAKLAASGDTTSARFITLKKAADDLAASIDPVAAAMQKFTKAAEEQANVALIMEAIEKRMTELAAAGKMATLEFRNLGDAYGKFKEEADSTGLLKLISSLRDAEAAAGQLQLKFDEINRMLAAGEISPALAQKAKDSLTGAGEAADVATEKVKSMSQAVAEAGASFVTDFTDKLIDSFGQVGNSFGDMVELMLKQVAKLMLNNYFQQFMKLAEGQAGTSGDWAWLGNMLTGRAKGAAFAGGVEYMAQGGIVSRPTMFAHGGGLGVMGEAGAEAIVPLQRNAAGNLGVAAAPTTINVINNAGAEVSTSERTNVDGSRQIDILVERKVKALMTGGAMDRTMRSSYGLTRQPVIG